MAWIFFNRNNSWIFRSICMHADRPFLFTIKIVTLFLFFSRSTEAATQPLILLLDAHQEATAQKTGAVTNYLAYSIIEKSSPIMVNGAVFHNFLLLQKKGNDVLNQQKYPTIQKLVTAVHQSKKETENQTLETVNYLKKIREHWYKSISTEKLSINETLIENAGHACLSLIPQTSVTTAINEAEYQIIPVLNQFLEIFQNQFSTFFKEYQSNNRDEINILVNNYNQLLKAHIQELEELKRALYKNLQITVDAHNLLTEFTFEYTYRFAEFKTDTWEIQFQKENDLYLLIPETSPEKNINHETVPLAQWHSHQGLFSMIAKNAIQAQGLYSLYQRSQINPLSKIDQFFKLKDGLYENPLDIFVIGHGSPQKSSAAYVKQLAYEQKRIGMTLQLLTLLISRCESELIDITQQSLKNIVAMLTNNRLISSQQYDIMAYEINKKFIDEQHDKQKNPLDPRPEDVEIFLQKQLVRLQQTDLDFAFYWLFLTNLMQKYQKSSYAIDSINFDAFLPTDYVPASAHLAGLTAQQLKAFVEQSIETKRIQNIFFLTCFGGGSNRLIFESMAQRLNEKRSVNLGVGSLTDAAVPSLIPTLEMFFIDPDGTISFNPPISFATFFEKKLSHEGLKAITVGQKYRSTSSVNEYFHGVADLPWKYNQKTKKLELVNLNNQLLDLTPKKLAELEENKKEKLSITEQKVLMLHEKNIPLTLTLNPEDQLLPLICSAKTQPDASHTIAELSLPNHTLEDLMKFSIGHLRQTKTYHITFEKLSCRGLINKKKDLISFKNVTIQSSFQEQHPEVNKNRPTENDLILWNINIGELPAHISSPTKLYCKDYFNQDKKRTFSQLFKK